MGSWFIDSLAGFVALMIHNHNFTLAFLLRYGISSGITPIVYLLGAADFGRKLDKWIRKRIKKSKRLVGAF